MKKKVKDVVHPDDVFIAILWKQGLATGESLYCTIEDILQESPASDSIPQDVRDYIISLWDSLTLDDLEELIEEDEDPVEALEFLSDCFSFYEDYEEYVRSHKCYSKSFVYTRDGAKPLCDITFYVFLPSEDKKLTETRKVITAGNSLSLIHI